MGPCLVEQTQVDAEAWSVSSGQLWEAGLNTKPTPHEALAEKAIR